MNNRVRSFLAKFRFQRVRTRFLAAMIVISLPPLFLLGFISFNIAKSTLMQTNEQTNEDHLETSSEVADLLFRNIVNLNRSIVMNDEVRAVLNSSNNKAEQSFEQGDLNDWNSSKLQKVINNNLFDTKFVNSICIFNLDFQTFCAGRSDDAGIYEKPDKAALIRQTDWYKQAAEEQGKVVFVGYDILGDSKDSFSTVKLFRDASTSEPIGLLITNISKSIFQDIFNAGSSSGGFLAIESAAADKPVHVVFNNALPDDKQPAEVNYASTLAALKKTGYLVSQYQNQTTGWTFIHLVKLKELLKQSNTIGTATTFMAVSMGVLALILSFFMSGSITRPLLQIKKMMVEWTKGTRSFQETFERDEVGAIGETFKRMASENRELTEKLIHSELKEREAELRALQAQIKPHFLYNTLDSIYWMATLQKNNDIAQMAVSLSESFKLSLNKGKEMISVFKELKHIEHYMTIQNIRYNNRFQYIEEVDASLMGMEIMKLLLQPLVENAIYHGLEPKLGEGTIRLSGKREGDFLVFTVEDNGIGIEDVSVTESGYGLRNVRERLLLSYGPTSELRIWSRVHEGTRIELRFNPNMKERDSDAESDRM
ncbi:cache domain-containing sensor histidine kinase [Paenibacillus hexagrammi]|uniref:Sensor histidine kinase n=1 Tax=Paenibacillus hexagrammi TaxID=2908839 RepID=A0ABY3SN09_9BACL|nr:histidine kinase [Paenibacillus sp. YPD9-1]UJF34510.1 sensor histidine kinase [Paenibacillus sp. YPD9-1]